MLIVSFPSVPDTVTESLCRPGPGGLRAWQAVTLRADLPLAANLAQVLDRAQERAALVGVGLAGTLLLALSALAPAGRLRRLALFPYLGVDASPYGDQAQSTAGAERWLRLARLPLLRSLMGQVALTPPPRGLEGVYPPGRLSWRHAAAALEWTEFAPLVAGAGSPLTLALNLASPTLRRSHAELVFPALNPDLELAFADPASGQLARRVQAWADGGRFDTDAATSHG